MITLNRREFIGQAGRLGELGIDLAEIHLAEIEPREFLESEAAALLGLWLGPRLVQLLATLLLQDP